MTEIKKYMSIVRLGHKTTADVLNKGDYITITEKVDGANASFTAIDGEAYGFSRNNSVNEDNTLRGFYGFVQTLDASNLLPNKRYFGEWCVKHKIDYGENLNKFYLFDIYDEETQEYLPLDFVKTEADRLKLNLVPIFYEGEYIDFEHLSGFIGKSELTEDGKGEGIVVKNVDYRDRHGKQIFVKLVSEGFREMQKQKAPKDPSKQPEEFTFVKTFMTKGRVEKLIHKLVDEGILEEKFGIEDMGLILRNLGDRVYEDMIKEESDSLSKEFKENNLRKGIGKNLPLMVKEIIAEM